jgi:hypothetical protein
MQKVQESVRRLDARLVNAQHSGALAYFNQEYKRRRQAAFAEGRAFMGYSAAKARLRGALVETKARNAPATIMTRIFER